MPVTKMHNVFITKKWLKRIRFLNLVKTACCTRAIYPQTTFYQAFFCEPPITFSKTTQAPQFIPRDACATFNRRKNTSAPDRVVGTSNFLSLILILQQCWTVSWKITQFGVSLTWRLIPRIFKLYVQSLSLKHQQPIHSTDWC